MSERRSETILKALLAALEAGLPAGASIERNAALSARVPAAGAVILRDGAPGEPEVMMSPLVYLFEHRAEVDVLVEAEAGARDAVFDALVRAVGAALTADRTLGGLCDWIEPGAPAPVDLADEGAAPLKAATIPVTLHYATESPVG